MISTSTAIWTSNENFDLEDYKVLITDQRIIIENQKFCNCNY